MKLTWWGTAALEIEHGGIVYWVDPYLTRNEKAFPKVGRAPEEVRRAAAIFLTHGHFDHIQDTARIAGQTGAMVHCSAEAADTLIGHGLATEQISVVPNNGASYQLCGLAATAHYSEHIKFDIPLIIKTLWRCGFTIGRFKHLMKIYPCGQVLAWRLALDGRELLVFGSGGSSAAELAELAKRPTDVLCVPLQGHSRIYDIALNYIEALRPRTVIPIHQDDFFPPISVNVDITPFREALRRQHPKVELLVAEVGQPFPL